MQLNASVMPVVVEYLLASGLLFREDSPGNGAPIAQAFN